MQITKSSSLLAETTDSKVLLMKHIEQTPGIRYRELLRLTGFVNGVLSYHLTALEEPAEAKCEGFKKNGETLVRIKGQRKTNDLYIGQ
jgi:predicted transcriptional regulator